VERYNSLRFTVYGLQFTVYSLQFAVYSLQFTDCALTENRKPKTVN